VITSDGKNETASDDATTDLPRKLPTFSVYEQQMSKTNKNGLSTVTCISDNIRGFGSDIGFIDHSQVVTTNNYNTIADFHTTAHKIKSSISALASRYWATGINNGYCFTVFSLSVSWQRIVTQEV
jgi:hypothetical protein